MHSEITYSARWIFPVSSSPLERGTITIRGSRIVEVKPCGQRHPDVDLGNVALIPGLVNPHVHLDLSGAHGQIVPDGFERFTDWLHAVINYRRTRTSEQVIEDIRDGLEQCLRSGTTLLGDVSYDGSSWRVLAGSPLRAIVFLERLGFTAERLQEDCLKAELWDRTRTRTVNCRPGVSPHAPYSIHEKMFTELASLGVPLATHLAESPAELELLTQHTGVFEVFLRLLGVWNPEAIVPSLEAVIERTRHAPRCLIIHANYLPLDTPLSSNQSIVYCPRTHAAFHHSPHPFRHFLERGVRVCLGTDSLASNPDLDIFSEACFLYRSCPDIPGETLLRMVTLNGAEALGWADECGSFESGKSADMVVIPLPEGDTADPYALLYESSGTRRTMFEGRWRT